MSIRMNAIALADVITHACSGNAALAYMNACNARNVDEWWHMTAQAANLPASVADHEMRTHVIAVLHRRTVTPDPFKGF